MERTALMPRPAGGIVSTPLRTTGSRNALRLHRGVSAMISLTLIAVGFLVATAVVMALARGSTARWERDKRAAVAVRAHESPRRTSAAGSALGIPSARTRRGVAALRSQVSRFPPVKVLARLVPGGMKQGTLRVRPIRRLTGVLSSLLLGGKLRGGRWTKSSSPALPVDGDGADMAIAPKPSRVVIDIRGVGVAGAARRKLLRRTVPRGRRRALAFLHRHEVAPDAHIPHEGSGESPAAR